MMKLKKFIACFFFVKLVIEVNIIISQLLKIIWFNAFSMYVCRHAVVVFINYMYCFCILLYYIMHSIYIPTNQAGTVCK